MLSPAVEALLKSHKSLQYDKSQNKVICQLTRHEMPSTIDAIESYVKGKKYLKAVQKSFEYDQYKPHIVPSSKRKHLHELFCTLTLRHVSKTPQAVERHVQGKKYKRALARWSKCQESGEKFVPQGGGRQRVKVKDSDSESMGSKGGSHWSDDSLDETNTDDDDLGDLYPAEIFGAPGDDDDEDSTESENEENKEKVQAGHPSGNNSRSASKADDSGENSDYDMNVLNTTDEVTMSNNSLQCTQATTQDKVGKKKAKKASREATETTSSKQMNGVKISSSVKTKKRKGTLDSESLKSRKKKKAKDL
ncbi:surfeit locus protein 2 [Plakobranchus ocellatus]|uniref:Surfeit locus protein 2 n=1 Tax=Plakobranchus ocellatus TaxID=259542 RepID=A0AAV3XZX1_9GAST|nr:surfeit locus protein 2 [Plakobranchus ocellatus]